MEPTYPNWARNITRYCLTVPVIGVSLFFVFVVMILSFQIQVNIIHQSDYFS